MDRAENAAAGLFPSHALRTRDSRRVRQRKDWALPDGLEESFGNPLITRGIPMDVAGDEVLFHRVLPRQGLEHGIQIQRRHAPGSGPFRPESTAATRPGCVK